MKPEEMRADIPMDVREALGRVLSKQTIGDELAALRSVLCPKPRTVHLPAAELPRPLEEVPEAGEVWAIDGSGEDAVWQTQAGAYDAVNNGFAWATQAEAEAWLRHLQSWKNRRPGDDWTPHTPGDPMPCDERAMVVVELPWVSVEERRPTLADADGNGRVLWGGPGTPTICAVFQLEMSAYTHWLPLSAIPLPGQSGESEWKPGKPPQDGGDYETRGLGCGDYVDSSGAEWREKQSHD
jgi:hypothetical protein